MEIVGGSPHRRHVDRIRQIDRILEDPVLTLIELVSAKGGAGDKWRSMELPSWLAEDRQAPDEPTRLTTALCLTTLQSVCQHRRRFPQFKKPLEKLARSLRCDENRISQIPYKFAEPFIPDAGSGNWRDYAATFTNKQTGGFDPLTAAEIFWLMMRTGEERAHSPVGFIAFFVLLWSLARSTPDRFHAGVTLTGSPPTAFATAMCLEPLFFLIRLCRRRASLLHDLREKIRKIEEKNKQRRGPLFEPFRRLTMPLELEPIVTDLSNLAEVSMNQQRFLKATMDLREAVKKEHNSAANQWSVVEKILKETFVGLGDEASQLLSKVEEVLTGFQGEIRKLLVGRNSKGLKKEFGIEELSPLKESPDVSDRYWTEREESFESASTLCTSCWSALMKGVESFGAITESVGGESLEILGRALDALANANLEVAGLLERGLRDPIQWCSRVLTREMAYAGAGNYTHFDSGELISALFVGIHADRIESSLIVRDAVLKSLCGKRGDGSWASGQPIMQNLPLIMITPTSAIMRMLASVISRSREVIEADEAFDQYVDWLERTRIKVKNPDSGGRPWVGWRSERALEPLRIDTWLTAFTIQALVSIRHLHESRLSGLCRKRFTVVEARKGLDDIDPVDLGLPHEMRLHHRLAEIVRDAWGEYYEEGTYSLVLHGPPGSSKTSLAEALAREILRADPKSKAEFIRITPADFTRRGEDQLDAEAASIFELLSFTRRTVILFDEIDDLLRRRKPESQKRFFDLVVPAMLNRLQDLREVAPKQEIFFLLATNFIDTIEPALIRKGRIDESLPLVYPDVESRKFLIRRKSGSLVERLRDRSTSRKHSSRAEREFIAQIEKFVGSTDFWPWMELNSLCESVVKQATARLAGSLAAGRGTISQVISDIIREEFDFGGERDWVAPYRGRGKRMVDSRHLCRELVFYLLSSGESADEEGHQRELQRSLRILGVGADDAVEKSIDQERSRLWAERRRARSV